MQEYKVDHSGSCRDKDGTLYTYKANKPVSLPEDVAKALGESAHPTGRTFAKDVKNTLNKMVGSEDAKTK